MKQLTLEHLAPYLPYGLKVLSGKYTVRTLAKQSRYGTVAYDNVLTGIGHKLILRALSDFNDSDADNEIFEIGQLYSSVELNELHEFPYWQHQILIKHHFDVFGLIDAGLAININSLNDLSK